MGGGGALIAADRYPDQVQAAIPFTPWQPDGSFDRITAPTLIITGAADRVAAVADHAWPHFQSIPATTPKLYLEVDGGDHFIADTTRGQDLATIGLYSIAWLKLHLDGDERYRAILEGDLPPDDRAGFSRYVLSP
jgi:dienelactone hydrolase